MQNDEMRDSKANARNNNARKKDENILLAYLHDFVFLITGVLLVFSLLFRVVVVSGSSMKSTLVDGDWLLLVGNVLYREPKCGDIIVASKDSFDNGAPIVKRVIATEGQEVDIVGKTVFVDGEPLNEPYALGMDELGEAEKQNFPQIVKEGCVFVLGDNRAVSMDSRNSRIGQIDCREILGRAIILVVPGNDGGDLERDFGRIGLIGE